MSKSNNQSNFLDSIEFVRDISPEVAANYRGGVGRINDGNNDPDVILYEDAGYQGQSIGINASIGDGIPDLGNFNDKTSSVKILKGKWEFYKDRNYGGRPSNTVSSGYDEEGYFTTGNNDALSSIKRIG